MFGLTAMFTFKHNHDANIDAKNIGSGVSST